MSLIFADTALDFVHREPDAIVTDDDAERMLPAEACTELGAEDCRPATAAETVSILAPAIVAAITLLAFVWHLLAGA